MAKPEVRLISGDTLKRIRIERKYSRNQLSILSGVNPHHLYKVESGKRGISLDVLNKLAPILGIKIIIQ